jgi:hypothetical protein
LRELKQERSDSVLRIIRICTQPIREIYRGFRLGTISVYCCLLIGIGAELILLSRIDYVLLKRVGLPIYPTGMAYLVYAILVSCLGFLLWGIRQAISREKMIDRLTGVFLNAGFKNAIGKLPYFISDHPVDDFSRKLRISNAGFPLNKFKSAKESLEASLQVYIDDMRENRSRATVDIIYAHEPMPKRTVIENLMALKGYKFVVGRTRATQVTSSLIENPHLMISGQTGGGKSTATRQIITTLYVNQPQTQFLLVDLKGGLEFQLFEGIRGIQVVGSVEQAARELSILDAILDERMEALKQDGSKDIEQFMCRHRKLAKGKSSRRTPLFRIVIVIDEAAEMFLVQDSRYAQSIQKARRVLSRIARLGRAVGVHLIVATQRPDKQSLDPQVKANLTGVLCFQMQNDASSISVLGNGRATDLPDIPGRAIWKSGPSMTEVQTPLMDPSEVEETFKSFRATELAEESIGEMSNLESSKSKES